MARTSCPDAYDVVTVTLAPHPLDRHVEWIEKSCGHVCHQRSSIIDVEGWIAQRFLTVPRSGLPRSQRRR